MPKINCLHFGQYERADRLLQIRGHLYVKEEVMLPIQYDGNNQPYIQWQQGTRGYKRAWIQHREGPADWAGTRRYLNIARTEGPESGPGGNATDFPIFSELDNEQVLEAFVAAVCAITGYPIPFLVRPSASTCGCVS